MRHTTEVGAFPSAGAARPQQKTATSPVPRGQLAFAVVAFLVAPYLGLDSFTVDDRIAEVWPLGGVGFVLLAAVWPAGRRAVAVAVTGMVAVTALTAVLLGFAPLASMWIGVCGAAQPLLMMLVYRRYRAEDGWVPKRPQDVFVMLAATLASATLVGVVGGYPTLSVVELPSHVLLWWVLRTSVFCFVVAMVFSVLFHSTPEAEVLAPTTWVNRIAPVPVAVLCVVGTYHDPSLPLSWLLLVPAVWGGMTLTLRGTAALILVVAFVAAGLTYLPQNQFGYDGWLPAASIVDLLIMAATCFALLLVLMRQQRARLIAELAQRGREAEHQRELLATVLDSMTEGVMLVGHGAVQTRNAAARQLLGRPVPTPGSSWVETFRLTGPDGEPLRDADLRRSVAEADGTTYEVRVGSGAEARVLEVVVKRVSERRVDDDAARVLLFRDVTAERARLRELTNFAGHVAHDLRGPLTVLDGWLEVTLDHESEPDEAMAALGHAYDASQRMRQVIEDWLAYTVAQRGQLNPEPVELEVLAKDVLEARVAGSGSDAVPQVSVDLGHRVLADPALLRQLLDNLVDNAVKYTDPGRQPVVSLRSHDDDEPGWVVVEVADEGMGIPAGQEEEIFEEFRTGPQEGRSQGTGLGLSVTRRIVALHGGEISARRNDPGRGSTFRFTLPRA